MSKIVLYPADGYDFDAADVAAYLAGLTSGVFSSAEDFPVTAADGLKVTVGAGRGWVHPSRFTGYSITKREADTLTLPLADPSLPRIDRIVMRYDAGARAASLQVLQGTASSTPTAPAISRTELIYDLCLAEITRPAGSTAVTTGQITDTRLDEKLCGIVRDGVTHIPTAELLAAAKAQIAELEETASDSSRKAAACMEEAAAAAKAAADDRAAAGAHAGNAEQALRDTTQARDDALQDINAACTEALDSVSKATAPAQEAAAKAGRKATEAANAAAAAAQDKTAADTSASAAKGSETQAASYLQGTKEYFEQVRTITIGAQGWYATPEALKAAVPTGENGWWAVIGTTDSIWVWDSDTNAWRNSMVTVNMSDYYTRTQVDEKLTDKANKTADDLNTMINALTTGALTPTDADYYVSQYVGGGTSTTTFHRRPMSALWAYIKSKAGSVFAAKSHTHNYAGSGSAGGSANSASKLDTATAGSATKPVYFSGGKPVPCTHSLGKDVPSNAVFTDHTYAKMTAATASAAGKEGLVPAPAAGAQGKFLRGDGTWQAIASSGLSAYPVGSIYQSTAPTSPAALFGGTWEQIASDRVLMGASSSHAAGTTVKAGLPNITGSTGRFVAACFRETYDPDRANGALSYSGLDKHGDFYSSSGSYGRRYYIDFDASKSNAIYGRSTTVQPATYYVYIWHRVA